MTSQETLLLPVKRTSLFRRLLLLASPSPATDSFLSLLLVLGGAAWLLGAGSAEAASGSKQGVTTNAPAEDLFSEARVYQLKVTVPDSALEKLRQEPRHYVKATVTEGSRTYEEVGLRLKGATNGTALEKKPGLVLKFNEFLKQQEFHGQSRILLSHSHSDPTYLADALGGELFRQAGVPATRTSFGEVELNARKLGLYVLGEAVNKEFLSRNFKKTKGNLYEGSHHDIHEKLEQDGGDTAAEQEDLRRLARAVKEPDLAQRWKKLGAVLDVERFIPFLATEVLVWHQGGYGLDHGNYRIYHQPASDLLVFLPHDLDRLCGKQDAPILPEWQGMAAKALVETPAGRQHYLESLQKQLDDGFRPEFLNTRIERLAALIRPVLARDDPMALRAFDEAVPQLRDNIAKRAAYVQKELQALAKPQ